MHAVVDVLCGILTVFFVHNFQCDIPGKGSRRALTAQARSAAANKRYHAAITGKRGLPSVPGWLGRRGWIASIIHQACRRSAVYLSVSIGVRSSKRKPAPVAMIQLQRCQPIDTANIIARCRQVVTAFGRRYDPRHVRK